MKDYEGRQAFEFFVDVGRKCRRAPTSEMTLELAWTWAAKVKSYLGGYESAWPAHGVGAGEWGVWRRECWEGTGGSRKNRVWHRGCALLPEECPVGERETLVCVGKITSSGKTWIDGVWTGQQPGGQRIGELQLSAGSFLSLWTMSRRPDGPPAKGNLVLKKKKPRAPYTGCSHTYVVGIQTDRPLPAPDGFPPWPTLLA